MSSAERTWRAKPPDRRPIRAPRSSSMKAERDFLLGIMETLGQSRTIDEYLEGFVEQVRDYSGCRYVGVRLLDDKGNIPYVAHTGFSPEFYESESPLCINTDRCWCINVMTNKVNPEAEFYTEGGSFFSGGMAELLASTPAGVIGEIRRACIRQGYETLALVPMKDRNRTLGLIHLADEGKDMLPMETLHFLERIGAYVGVALHTLMAEEALRESEARYHALFEQAADSVVLVDVETGALVEFNERAYLNLGYSRKEFEKTSISDFEVIESTEGVQRHIEKIVADGADVFDTRHRTKGGDIRDVQVSARAIQIGGKNFILSVWRDITEHKKLDELKDEFIGLVSHELRSPLTVIMGAVSTALSEAEHLSPEETRQLLQDAAWETESLSHLLGNLLELSRAQADRLLLHVEPVEVNNVVQDTVDRIKHQTTQHRFVVDIPADLPRVNADALRLERILYNLLENAVRYSPHGGEIRISARLQDEAVVFAVADQGVGLSPADQEKIFGPFQRLEDPRFREGGGVGLGLLVCRRLVEVHGGHIWVESEPGHGSTFLFTLPADLH